MFVRINSHLQFHAGKATAPRQLLLHCSTYGRPALMLTHLTYIHVGIKKAAGLVAAFWNSFFCCIYINEWSKGHHVRFQWKRTAI